MKKTLIMTDIGRRWLKNSEMSNLPAIDGEICNILLPLPMLSYVQFDDTPRVKISPNHNLLSLLSLAHLHSLLLDSSGLPTIENSLIGCMNARRN